MEKTVFSFVPFVTFRDRVVIVKPAKHLFSGESDFSIWTWARSIRECVFFISINFWVKACTGRVG